MSCSHISIPLTLCNSVHVESSAHSRPYFISKHESCIYQRIVAFTLREHSYGAAPVTRITTPTTDKCHSRSLTSATVRRRRHQFWSGKLRSRTHLCACVRNVSARELEVELTKGKRRATRMNELTRQALSRVACTSPPQQQQPCAYRCVCGPFRRSHRLTWFWRWVRSVVVVSAAVAVVLLVAVVIVV